MARQNMRNNPAQKHMHAYQNFSGGLNTVDADEKILDRELTSLVNVEIGERGSLKRRTGHKRHIPNWTMWSDIGQMKWRDF